jgi:hypothetical protein
MPITLLDILRKPSKPLVTPITLPLTPGEECFICKRDYGVVDDPDDLNEHPEYPIQLHPCKHIVGHRCMNEWISRNPMNQLCPYCSAKLIQDSIGEMSLGIKTLLTVCDTKWFRYQDNMGVLYTTLVEDFLRQDPQQHDQTRRQSAMARTLSWEAAYYICSSATFGALVSLLFIFGVPVHLGAIAFFLLGFDPSFLYKIFLTLVILNIVAFAIVVHYVVGLTFARSYRKSKNE